MEIFFDMSEEYFISWSHASLITNLKAFAIKILVVCPEIWREGKKENKN